MSSVVTPGGKLPLQTTQPPGRIRSQNRTDEPTPALRLHVGSVAVDDGDRPEPS
jgi:hypothetical protein